MFETSKFRIFILIEILIKYTLILHVVAGTVSLISGLAAILLRKKMKWHKPAGKIYFIGMTLVFVTSTIVSVAKGNVFLFCVGVFTYYSCLTAYRSLRLKKLHLGQRPEWYDWAIEVVFGIVHIAFVVFALLAFSSNTALGTIALVFGIIGVMGNYNTIKRLKAKKFSFKNYWLLAHIGGMLGSYIGAITAFVVNNGEYIPVPPIVLWLGPTFILVPFMILELRKQKEKGGVLPQ